MSEKPLLLFSARSGVIVTSPKPTHWLRKCAIALGVFAVLVGGADIAARASQSVFGDKAAFVAFAPAAAIADPSLLASLTAQSASTTPLLPATLVIPSLSVNAPVENVGKKADGSMGTPSTFGSVAWYALGSKPGEAGNAVFDGHVNNALTTAGVFEHLSQIQLGATVEVLDKSGHNLSYIVTSVQDYPATSKPDASIFATSGPSQIVLITCDGEWVTSQHGFSERLVIVARLLTL